MIYLLVIPTTLSLVTAQVASPLLALFFGPFILQSLVATKPDVGVEWQHTFWSLADAT